MKGTLATLQPKEIKNVKDLLNAIAKKFGKEAEYFNCTRLVISNNLYLLLLFSYSEDYGLNDAKEYLKIENIVPSNVLKENQVLVQPGFFVESHETVLAKEA